MTKPVIAWSFSALDSYHTCPQKHYRTRIKKDVEVDWSGAAVTWGRDVHSALDRRLRLGAQLPSNMSQYETAAAKMEALAERTGLNIHTELQLACDQKLRPCGWKDWNNCWARSALDVALIHPTLPIAMAWDWKTGKVKDGPDADLQLAIQALLTFIYYPHVNKVLSGFVWLKEGTTARVDFTRAAIPKMLRNAIMPRVRALTDAAIEGNWPPRPSGLCAQYCEVIDCRFNGSYTGDKQ